MVRGRPDGLCYVACVAVDFDGCVNRFAFVRKTVTGDSQVMTSLELGSSLRSLKFVVLVMSSQKPVG